MSDAQFLQWIYDRLQHIHKENPSYDYMIKLRTLIERLDEDDTNNS